MNVQDFFNQEKVIDLSFFNFENAITAAYYANDKLEVQKVNKNFVNFFPVLGNITNVYFPDVLDQLGVPEEQISQFQSELDKNGKVLIPQILINIDGEEKTASGIIIPDSAQEKPMQGKIIAVGNGARDDSGKIIPLDVKAGDTVLFGKWSGTEVKIDNDDYLIMKESDIMGVL